MDLKKVRLEHNWSQDQLAEISGVSTRTIQRIENGNPPSMETLKALAAGFGVSVEELKNKLSSDQPGMAAQVHDDTSFRETVKDWRSFMLHTLIFMAVITWLLVLQQYFAIDQEIIGVVGLIWGAALASHLAKTVAKVTQEREAD